MTLLRQNEKVVLLIYVILAIIMLCTSLYLATSIQNKNKTLLSNKINVIHTGGDIEEDFKEKSSKNSDKIGQFDINTYNPPISSSTIVPNDWNNIATDILNSYNKYDGFVIVCGKDTMTYTASALAFMLENLNKPVLLTDKQLTEALMLISQTKIGEVMILSQGNLLRGCRSVLKSAEHFDSPNYPPLNNKNALKNGNEPVNIKYVNPKINIILVKVFPGMDSKYLASLTTNNEIHGIVFEVYSSGNIPLDKGVLGVINAIAKKGIVMVAVLQCDHIFKKDIDIRLLEAGVLSGGDMTASAAFAKLHFLLGNVKEKKLIGKLIEQSFRGEMSV